MTSNETPAPPRGPSNLAIRLATVGALGPLLLLVLFKGPPIAWAVLIWASAALAARELVAMTHPGDFLSQAVAAGFSALLGAALYYSAHDSRWLVSALCGMVIISMILPLVRLVDLPGAAQRTFSSVTAPLYVGLLLSTLALLRRDQADLGPRFVFLSLTIAWMGDTGGYTFGRLFGKTKLYALVSPKKTREGLLGSVVFSTFAALLASFTYLPSLPPLAASLLGALGGVVGQLGDLAESLIKRSTGVKDSGSLLPGHGGLLDRIDALLMVGPIVYLYVLWFA